MFSLFSMYINIINIYSLFYRSISKYKMAGCSDQRSVYLITYSNADLDKIKTREEFAELWTNAFGEDIVKQWACCCEKHKENDKVHFHLALKLKRVRDVGSWLKHFLISKGD